MTTLGPIKISARKSDLARLQAYQVGQALKLAGFQQITYEFSSSLGDQNSSDPLWQMPEKGVFTSDLTQALIAGGTDVVVHSWKDLPTDENSETLIAATLPRADARDVLLVKKTVAAGWARNVGPGANTLRVLSSSPRRAYQLKEFLKWAIPLKPQEVVFENVRGNIQTRVRKLMEGDSHALVVAKAALDRLLASAEEEFQETRTELRAMVAQCRFVVLPLSECPGAAAQGALAIETRRDRADLIAALKKINCADTFKDVNGERATLRSYGGGCHQKIGVTYLSRPYGQVRFLKGLTDGGEILNQATIVERKIEGNGASGNSTLVKAPAADVFPLEMADSKFYTREHLKVDLSALKSKPHLIWISRDEALPENSDLHADAVVWAAGLKSWRKLVERGYWVSGSADGLGERESVGIDILLGEVLPAIKLAHSEAPHGEHKIIATYKLHDLAVMPNLSEKTHFFWASSSAFERALRRYPEIAEGDHACGPGHTYHRLREILGAKAKIHLFLSYKEWRDAVLLNE